MSLKTKFISVSILTVMGSCVLIGNVHAEADKKVIEYNTDFQERMLNQAESVRPAAEVAMKKITADLGSIPNNVIDYGIYGSTYGINDPDVAIWGAAMVNRYMRENPVDEESIKEQIYNTKLAIPRTVEALSYKVDMSVTVPEDQFADISDTEKILIAKKGTIVNPFVYAPLPYTVWFLNEGDDEYLAEAMKSELSLILIANGNLKRISVRHPGISLAKATRDITARMAIKSIPAKAIQCKSVPLLCVDLMVPSDG